MAQVLTFVPRDRIAGRPATKADAADAAIIIFPGVRYERPRDGERDAPETPRPPPRH